MSYMNIPKRNSGSFKAAMFGLAGAAYAGVLNVTETQPHDTALKIAFCAFAIAIPLLIALAIVVDIAQDPKYVRMSAVGFAALAILNLGSWAFVVGFAAFLWHYSITCAVAFLIFACVGMAAFVAFQFDLIKANP